MHVLIVLAHPDPGSFNAALAQAGAGALRAAGHDVVVSDLYAEGFNPVAGRHDFTSVADASRFHYQAEQAHAARTGGFAPDLAREQARLRAADLVIFQCPLWWGGVPAMLKGWFERVLAYGVAYVDGHRFDTGLFRGRRALLSITTGGTEERFSDGGVYGPVDRVLWQAQRLTLGYMGFETEAPFVAHAVPRINADARAACLDRFRLRVLDLAARPVDRSLATENPLGLVDDAAWTRKQ